LVIAASRSVGGELYDAWVGRRQTCSRPSFHAASGASLRDQTWAILLPGSCEDVSVRATLLHHRSSSPARRERARAAL